LYNTCFINHCTPSSSPACRSNGSSASWPFSISLCCPPTSWQAEAAGAVAAARLPSGPGRCRSWASCSCWARCRTRTSGTWLIGGQDRLVANLISSTINLKMVVVKETLRCGTSGSAAIGRQGPGELGGRRGVRSGQVRGERGGLRRPALGAGALWRRRIWPWERPT